MSDGIGVRTRVCIIQEQFKDLMILKILKYFVMDKPVPHFFPMAGMNIITHFYVLP